MEEKTVRKLHPLLETLIIGALILGCNLAYAFVLSEIVKGKSYDETMAIQKAVSWLKLTFPFISALLCVKVVEKRSIGAVKVVMITLCVCLLLVMPSAILFNYMARFGMQALVSFSSASVYVSPVVIAILITVFVNIFDAPRTGAYIYDEKMHCGLFGHVLLLLFTFEIWPLIWTYRVTRYLNCAEGETYRNPAVQLLLCMFVPFYPLYWTYKSAQRIDKLAKSVQLVSDLATPCLILEIFVSFIPPILMQDKINQILETDKNQA